jgi:hypothetical protein
MIRDIGDTVAELKIQYPTKDKKSQQFTRVRLGTRGILIADSCPVWTKSFSSEHDNSIRDLNEWANLLNSDSAANFKRSYNWLRIAKPEKVYRLKLDEGSKSTVCSSSTIEWAPDEVRYLIHQLESYSQKRK